MPRGTVCTPRGAVGPRPLTAGPVCGAVPLGICWVTRGTLAGGAIARGLARLRPTVAGFATRVARSCWPSRTAPGMASRMKGRRFSTAVGGRPLRILVILTLLAKLLMLVILMLVTRETKGKGGPKQ